MAGAIGGSQLQAQAQAQRFGPNDRVAGAPRAAGGRCGEERSSPSRAGLILEMPGLMVLQEGLERPAGDQDWSGAGGPAALGHFLAVLAEAP